MVMALSAEFFVQVAISATWSGPPQKGISSREQGNYEVTRELGKFRTHEQKLLHTHTHTHTHTKGSQRKWQC